ncbi:MAG: hypothetical protein RR234_02765 [Christensenella sp.]
MSKIIAITGANGSGKTATAIQLALACEAKKETVLLVFGDSVLPPKAYLCKPDDAISLGQLLTMLNLTDKIILESVTTITANMGIIGYCAGETGKDYPQVTRTGTTRFLDEISIMADTIIFDITRSEDLFSQVVLDKADIVLQVINATVKGAAWCKKNRQYLERKTKWVLNDVRREQALEAFPNEESIVLPHALKLAENIEEMSAFQKISDKRYCKAMEILYQKIAIQKKNIRMVR